MPPTLISVLLQCYGLLYMHEWLLWSTSHGHEFVVSVPSAVSWPRKARSYGRKLVTGVVKSRVIVLMSLKTRRAKELIEVKSVEVQSPHVGMVWKQGELGSSSGFILIVVRHKLSLCCFAFDVNKHLLVLVMDINLHTTVNIWAPVGIVSVKAQNPSGVMYTKATLES
ncbi:hypothetical protein TNCV_3659271 [Trichonephila clavipes]|nr:hypothetical protein TNCV_3659271 [Trichonephila clavipes]